MSSTTNDAPGSETTGTFDGRCLCGSVRFQVRGPLGRLAYCHCTSCQRASGSAFAVNTPVRSDNVVWHKRDTISEYESSPGKRRAFCSTCGSPIYARTQKHPDWLSIRLGLIQQDPGRRPEAHFNVSEKAPWYAIADELPQYAGDEAG